MTKINITKTFLPPLHEYENYLSQIWANNQITNQGPLLLEFEAKAASYLGVDNFHFVSNGTIALQLALNALNITDGEVITTPFSYVATTSSILWERCTPVFVDIDADTYCIDPKKIEAAITPMTKAIMPVHVFGFPCDVEAIEVIAKQHKLKVIYDGAHAFGVEYKGKSLLSYGDISTCSFHATKLFHTIEGGCVITPDSAVSSHIELAKRFGHNGDEHLQLGINAKATEFQAAMGLCNLEYVDQNIEDRKALWDGYDQSLNSAVRKPKIPSNSKHNYGYYPILFRDEATLLNKVAKLNAADIFPRRYFYPALNTLPYLAHTNSCPIAEDTARRVLCLPLYPGLSENVTNKICEIINS